MLLTDSDIKAALKNAEISFGNSFDYSRIQPASVDLTAGNIYVPGSIDRIRRVKNLSKLAIEECLIEPGETVVIELAESVDIGKGYGGILLPPNSLTKNGIIMTNPGHIDPGYQGKLTVCLINMGKEAVILKSHSSVATLLLFKLSATSLGYQKEPGKGATLDQLSKLSKDFANTSERTYSYIKKAIWGHLAAAFAAISILIALLSLLVPGVLTIISRQLETDFTETKNGEAIKTLEEKLKVLQLELDKQKNSRPNVFNVPTKRIEK